MNDTATDVRVRRSIPQGARIASAIWIVLGAIGLLRAAAALVSTAGLATWLSDNVALLFVFGVFISVGVQTLRSKVRDITANGVSSIILGVLYACSGFFWKSGFFDSPMTVLWGLAWITGLLSAGGVALIARADYKRWQARVGSS